jgi:hypothetical protein
MIGAWKGEMCVLLSLRCKLEARIERERERERESESLEAGDPKGAEVQERNECMHGMGTGPGPALCSVSFLIDPLDFGYRQDDGFQDAVPSLRMPTTSAGRREG